MQVDAIARRRGGACSCEADGAFAQDLVGCGGQNISPPACRCTRLQGYEYFGIHSTRAGTAYREWAPAARAAQIVGDFNDWQGQAMTREPNGVWTIELPNGGRRGVAGPGPARPIARALAGRPGLSGSDRRGAVAACTDALLEFPSIPLGVLRQHARMHAC